MQKVGGFMFDSRVPRRDVRSGQVEFVRGSRCCTAVGGGLCTMIRLFLEPSHSLEFWGGADPLASTSWDERLASFPTLCYIVLSETPTVKGIWNRLTFPDTIPLVCTEKK